MSRAPVRDTEASPFAAILEALVARVPGAFAAAMVDQEGECVDYTGRGDPYDLKVAAATWAIVLADAAPRLSPAGALRTLLVRASRRSYLVQALPDGYALLLLLGRRAGFTASRRALDLCARALAAEASWPAPEGPRWYPVRVECRAHRPSRVAAEALGETGGGAPRQHTVEVLGTLVTPDPRERGFRLRLDSGVELTVVREAGGFWYADEPIPTARAHN